MEETNPTETAADVVTTEATDAEDVLAKAVAEEEEDNTTLNLI